MRFQHTLRLLRRGLTRTATKTRPSCTPFWPGLGEGRRGSFYCCGCFFAMKDSLEIQQHLLWDSQAGRRGRCKPEDIVFDCDEHGVEEA